MQAAYLQCSESKLWNSFLIVYYSKKMQVHAPFLASFSVLLLTFIDHSCSSCGYIYVSPSKLDIYYSSKLIRRRAYTINVRFFI